MEGGSSRLGDEFYRLYRMERRVLETFKIFSRLKIKMFKEKIPKHFCSY